MNKIDWNLKFIRDVFHLECLHFGYWQDNQQITIDNLKIAQEKYIDKIIQYIPKNIKSILDVGAGTGEIAKKLCSLGYYIESVSPDSYQEKIFKEKCPKVNFYLSKFENLSLNKKFDLILFAESFQYIKIDRCFENIINMLNKDGVVIIADYFRKTKTNYYKTTHLWEEVINNIKKYNFQIVYEEDITNNILPTLTLARNIYEKYALPIIEILSGLIKEKMPIISKIFSLLFYKPLKKMNYYIFTHTRAKLDEKEFKENLSYKILVLKMSNS